MKPSEIRRDAHRGGPAASADADSPDADAAVLANRRDSRPTPSCRRVFLRTAKTSF